jgi:hypothetical protein
VGLVYNPFKDQLHASTRKGSSLLLYQGVLGFFKNLNFIRKSMDFITSGHKDYDKMMDCLDTYFK